MQMAMVGLGRMGANIVRRLMRGGHECVVYDVNPESVASLAAEGAVGADGIPDLAARLTGPRVVWLMIPAGLTGSVVDEVAAVLEPGDILIDGGNSNYRDDVRRAARLAERGIHYVDVGTSGGVFGLERGYCLMVGGPDAALSPVPTPWHTDRIRVLTWAGHLAACVALGSTIARTVLIGTRPEIGELRLSATGASSAMPQKANPTSAVLLHRNGMRAPGALATVTTAAAEAVEERSDGAWHAEWAPLAELMVLALSSLSLLEDMVAGLSVEPEAMRRNLDAASPGIYGERLTTAFGDRLTKTQIQEIIVPGGDPSARLATALADTPGPTPPRAELEGFFAPEDYLGEAEDIRQTIISTITDRPAAPAL